MSMLHSDNMYCRKVNNNEDKRTKTVIINYYSYSVLKNSSSVTIQSILTSSSELGTDFTTCFA